MRPAGWLLGLAALALAGGAEVRRFEARAAAEIRERLGGQGKVAVKTRGHGPLGYVSGDLARVRVQASGFSTEGLPLFTEPERSKRGKVRKLELDLREFELAGLRVERLEATIPDCRFDLSYAQRRQRIRLSKSGTGTGRVVVRQEDLQAYALRRFPGVKRLAIRLEGDVAHIEGHAELYVARSDFAVTARLIPLDGSKIALADPQILFEGRPAEPGFAKALLESLTPLVDLDRDLRLHGALTMERIQLKGGRLEASGPARIPTLQAGAETPGK